MKHRLVTAALALLFVGAAFAAGPHRRGAVMGASISGATAMASILALGWFSRGPRPIQRALAVLTAGFLVRILLLALGVVAVVRGGGSILGFVVAFFVPYFVFTAIEGLYVHSLRGTGPTA